MWGAVIGDILGSTWEGKQSSTRLEPIFTQASRFTDDTVCTMALYDAVLNNQDITKSFQKWGLQYPSAGYSRKFKAWINSENPLPYMGVTNGSLMRISPAAFLSKSLEGAQDLAKKATEISHNHPDALKAVKIYTHMLWAALNGASKNEVCDLFFYYGIKNHDIEKSHMAGVFRMGAIETLEDVLTCLINTHDYSGLIREAIYLGGDTDTICAIAGAIGEALWGIPQTLQDKAKDYLPSHFINLLDNAYKREIK